MYYHWRLAVQAAVIQIIKPIRKITQINGDPAKEVGSSKEKWYTSDVNIEITGSDQSGEPIHYEYKLIGKNENWQTKEINEKIEITDEGETWVDELPRSDWPVDKSLGAFS